MSGKLTILKGDATGLLGIEKKTIIAHCCNSKGAWGAGFVLALDGRFGVGPKNAYQAWASGRMTYNLQQELNCSGGDFGMGKTQFVTTPILGRKDSEVVIANMIGQIGTVSKDNPCPVHYGYLGMAMEDVGCYAKDLHLDIHCPQFGCGLAKGDLTVVTELIKNIWVNHHGLDVIMYQYD